MTGVLAVNMDFNRTLLKTNNFNMNRTPRSRSEFHRPWNEVISL